MIEHLLLLARPPPPPSCCMQECGCGVGPQEGCESFESVPDPAAAEWGPGECWCRPILYHWLHHYTHWATCTYVGRHVCMYIHCMMCIWMCVCVCVCVCGDASTPFSSAQANEVQAEGHFGVLGQ